MRAAGRAEAGEAGAIWLTWWLGDVCSELSCERFAIERLEEFRALAAPAPPPRAPAVLPRPRPAQLVLPGM